MSAVAINCSSSLVHTYPDIFESATFSFQIQKRPRPYIAYSKSNSPVYTHPMVSGFTLEKLLRSIRCHQILVYCLIRDWTRFGYATGFENILFRYPHVVGFVADLCFSTLESGFKNICIRCQIRRVRVDGSRIRKVADSKISAYEWTKPKSAHN